MAILVTGGAGYIGSAAVKDLSDKGETVIVLDNLVYGHRQAVDSSVTFYEGEIGQTVGPANWPEKQRRVLDEALRLIEPLDQPTVWKLVVDLESEVEHERGER